MCSQVPLFLDERPENRDHLDSGDMLDRNDLYLDLVIDRCLVEGLAVNGILATDTRWQDIHKRSVINGDETMRLEDREESRIEGVTINRFGGDHCHLALDARIDEEVRPCHLGDHLRNFTDVGILEVDRDLIGCREAGCH